MIEPIFQIKKEKETQTEGVFFLEPLEPGYGYTLGNALRRILLTSLPGAAVTFVKIAGARHQFTTLPGLKEDLAEFSLNIKKLRIRLSGEKPVKLELETTGPGPIKASQIKAPAGAEIVNKDLVLGNLSDKKAKIACEMTAERGFGYSPFEERKSETLGVIPIDALFSPVVHVNCRVETTRVGRMADYDRLVLQIQTDGTIFPFQALEQAAKILIAYFRQIAEPKQVAKRKKGEPELPAEVLRLTVEEISLPTRIANALEKSGYKTVGDLVAAKLEEIVAIKNLGEKSLKIIQAALKEKGVSTSW